MKPAREWVAELADVTPGDDVQLIEGRGGEPTLRVKDVFLHSRYRPREEAARLIDSAGLDFERPILVVGLGLGYHVIELLNRKADAAVVEPDPAVAKLALEGPMRDSCVLLGVGDPEAIAATDGFRELAAKVPQVLVHPATARVHPGYADAVVALLSRASLSGRRLRIAVVGPMYGGSLPIAGYLERAFGTLGHTTLLVDNSRAYGLYEAVTEGVKTKQARSQLAGMFTNFLGEWSYARTVEFMPDICVVLAQAPVGITFPARLAKEGVVTAFWYVENWRHLPYWQDIAPYYDFFFHIQPGEFDDKLDAINCRHHAVVHTGCDPDIHKPVKLTDEERREYGCDISFAGAGYYNRIEFFKGLTDYDFKIWGVDWNARELRHLLCRPDERFTPERFAKVVAGSKININLHSSTTQPGVDPKCDAINPRVFEIAACGGFQLCDPSIGLDALFDFETELPVYRDLAEARSKIDYFLARPEESQAVADKARERVLRDHTYAKRAEQMLDLITEHHGARILKKGLRVQRTVSEVAERAGKDTSLGRYLASLPPDLLFTQENINERLACGTGEMTYPEKVLVFLREMRDFAETLLENR